MRKLELLAEVERLRDKCDKQAMMLQRLSPDRHAGVYFLCGEGGEKDRNGLPERVHICPAYGCDWSEVYARIAQPERPSVTLDVDRLIELVAMCEKASGPDRELDGAIHEALGKCLHSMIVKSVEVETGEFDSVSACKKCGTTLGYAPLRFTASLDAALSLVPEGSWWHEIKGPRRYLNIPSPVPNYWSVHLSRWNHEGDVMGWGATPALAMCVASLKALRAMSVAEQKDASI